MNKTIVFLVLCLMIIECDPKKVGTSTPEDAIRSIENAYRKKDIEEVVSLKDFTEEARRMLNKINPNFSVDQKLLDSTAEILELSFRKEIKVKGFPPFDSARCLINGKKTISLDHVKILEECLFLDGSKSEESVDVIKGKYGWKIVTVQ